jgi:EmrB/QacA subfamily drug resistance transporter
MQHRATRPIVRSDAVDRRRSWSLLILLCAAQFMVIVDITVVTVALPSIGRTLRFASPADLQWVVTIYVLVSGGLVLLGGRAADLLGRRQVLLAGLLLFTGASLASGLAPSPLALEVARAVQGAGAGLLTPAALSIITTTYTGRQRAVALAVWAAIGAAGAAAGVLLGGALTSWLGWSSIFFVNVPIGTVTAAFVLRLTPASPVAPEPLRELDLPGAATLISGLVMLVYGIEGAATDGWASARALVGFVLAIGLLAGFAVIEGRTTRPLIPPSVWRMRSLLSGSAMMLGATGVMGASFFLNSLYLQRALGATPLGAGLAFLPFAIVIAAGAHVSSRLLPRLGTRAMLVIGLATAAGGTLLLASTPDHAAYLANVLPGLMAVGVGLGLSFVAVSITLMADVRDEQAGLASGLMTTAHEVGAALGVALVSAVATGAAAGSFVTGYRTGMLAIAFIAAVLAVVALLAVPTVRPPAGSRVHMH